MSNAVEVFAHNLRIEHAGVKFKNAPTFEYFRLATKAFEQ